MGLLDKLIASVGVAVIGGVATMALRDVQETWRRKHSPLCFDEGIAEDEFREMVRDAANRTPRVLAAETTGMCVTLHVKSNSGLSTWTAEVDFNDYGHLTGEFWLKSENSRSLVPEHFSKLVQAQIVERVTRRQ